MPQLTAAEKKRFAEGKRVHAARKKWHQEVDEDVAAGGATGSETPAKREAKAEAKRGREIFKQRQSEKARKN